MTANLQYRLNATDLEIVLAMARTGTLAAAAERLGVDASTVFRALQRIERGLGQQLFERSRTGYLATDLAHTLTEHAEHMELALESARSASQSIPGKVSGTVRITTTDTLLHGLVAPALKALRALHPTLNYDLQSGNELASLTLRDADIAVRATRRPPQHLVGRRLGTIRVAMYTAKKGSIKRYSAVENGDVPWVAPDDGLPEHPSVIWRKRHFPSVVPVCRVSSVHTVMELVALGFGVGLLPMFLAESRKDLSRLTEAIDECATDLWLLTHPESHHLRRVSVVYGHLASVLSLR